MVVFVQTLRPPETLENLVPQTLGKTMFDFVRFLAAFKKRWLVQAAAFVSLGLAAVVRRNLHKGRLSGNGKNFANTTPCA